MNRTHELLLNILDDAFNGSGWQGPHNLFNTVEELTLDQITFSSRQEGYNVWQIILHCAYWKWFVRKVLVGEEAGEFPRAPADFPSLPSVRNIETWKADLDFLLVEHRATREAVAGFPRDNLWDIVPRGEKKTPYIKYIYGVAAHDVYHTGQIRNMGVPGI
jgi:hypothetical protein